MTIIAEYKASAEFKTLALSSRRSYLTYIELIEGERNLPQTVEPIEQPFGKPV